MGRKAKVGEAERFYADKLEGVGKEVFHLLRQILSHDLAALGVVAIITIPLEDAGIGAKPPGHLFGAMSIVRETLLAAIGVRAAAPLLKDVAGLSTTLLAARAGPPHMIPTKEVST